MISHKNKGFIGLITVLLAGAVAVLIGSAVMLRSITESTISSDEEKSAIAWATVNGCVEYGLLQLASTTDSNNWDTFGGEQDLVIGEHSCYILEVEGSGTGTTTPTRTIRASSTIGDFVRKVEVVVATNTPSLIIDSWTEVADF